MMTSGSRIIQMEMSSLLALDTNDRATGDILSAFP